MTTFKIYPTKNNPFIEHNKTKYAKICVFGSRDDMYDWCEKKFYYSEERRNYAAIVISTPCIMKLVGDDWVTKDNKCVATALFCPTNTEGKVGGSIVVHESVHIAMAMLRDLKKVPKLDPEDCDGEEEKLAYIIQSVDIQISQNMYKKGLW